MLDTVVEPEFVDVVTSLDRVELKLTDVEEGLNQSFQILIQSLLMLNFGVTQSLSTLGHS